MTNQTDRLDPIGLITHPYAYELISEAQTVIGELYPELLMVGLKEECGLKAIGMNDTTIHYDPEIVLSITMEQLLEIMEQVAFIQHMKTVPVCNLVQDASAFWH